ncbi:outer membrane protein assembly factor BamD [Cardinium endosymbiont of Philonthus spinipes]|uniref:outer membrane protein assembly factor BamD n=1 Tax=Cardinium endosymbiont of Philonthus spinipes TaxID=3077941 RepID=UPI00313D07AB
MKEHTINPSLICRLRWLFLLPCILASHALLATPPTHSTQIEQKKEEVVRFYAGKRYAKAHEQIDSLLPMLKDRKDRSKFELYQAYCNFHEKKYLVSAHQFHLFAKQYPFFPQAEEALFMRGYSLASENVDIWLDQTTTYDAMRCLKHYLAVYPTGAYARKASHALQKLQERLVQKSFQAAALYVRLGYYNAAIVALKNFEQAYPTTSLKENLLRLLIKCYDKLAMQAGDVGKKQAFIANSAHCVQQLDQYLNEKKCDVVDKK